MSRVLIACEFSGIVRRAFAARGHYVRSCDLLPSDDDSDHHIIGDARELLDDGWDLLIAHSPCTRLTNAGVRWLHEAPSRAPSEASEEEQRAWPEMSSADRLVIMWRLLDEGASLFSSFWNAPIERVAVENPVMHPYAKQRIRNFQSAAQTVQPWQFGEPQFKGVGLHLRGLPKLAETNRLTPPKPGTDEHKRWSRVHRMSPGPNRWKERSRFFPGIAAAMADQWGSLLPATLTQEASHER